MQTQNGTMLLFTDNYKLEISGADVIQLQAGIRELPFKIADPLLAKLDQQILKQAEEFAKLREAK